MNILLVAWAKDGKYRLESLKTLATGPFLSSELAAKLQIHRSAMSRILRDLKDKQLVDRIQGDSRTVAYVITNAGKKLLNSIEAK